MAHRITLYDTLGVKSDASEQDIRAAFRRLTRDHHPDRFSGPKRQAAEQRFQAITEAFNVLSRPDSRERYDRELAQRSAAPSGSQIDAREIARRLAAKGAEALRAGRVQEAVEHLQMAVDHDAEYDRASYFLGLALGRVRGRQRDALRYLERAVVLDPNSAAYKAHAAAAALANGMTSRAERLAQDALALDPTSDKATSVLAAIRAAAGPKRDGLFGRLRRKG
ncbi:MAG TPA: J domain-containing protein [Thermoanaerobaculales bacterium]|nr:J domain-containing protein [Thermoanaerobaculales bacterium]HPA82369.1 J domain-containing protein [Thermoanaerobaculales bacterium]HQN97504.1 J domain-containing protein [Thermoanaerobaculales bacterium]HQP45004.1 J domain-containing protein [Thermoanaerobaculales bacterium]